MKLTSLDLSILRYCNAPCLRAYLQCNVIKAASDRSCLHWCILKPPGIFQTSRIELATGWQAQCCDCKMPSSDSASQDSSQKTSKIRYIPVLKPKICPDFYHDLRIGRLDQWWQVMRGSERAQVIVIVVVVLAQAWENKRPPETLEGQLQATYSTHWTTNKLQILTPEPHPHQPR